MNCNKCQTNPISIKSTSGFCRPCYLQDYLAVPENKKRKSDIAKLWAKNNPERHREKSLAWQRANPERAKQTYRKTASGLVNRFTRQKYRAEKQRGITWSLTREEYGSLITKPCHYCEGHTGSFGVGLDRMNSSLGYTCENVVPCCGDCNIVKSDILTYEEMKAAMLAVLKLRTNKQT